MVQEIDGKLTKTEPLEGQVDQVIMTASKSLTIICRHGGVFVLCINCFWNCLYGRYEVLELIIKRWNLKEVAQADIAEYMKTAPDMMDEKR
jgi:hypothetical protein